MRQPWSVWLAPFFPSFSDKCVSQFPSCWSHGICTSSEIRKAFVAKGSRCWCSTISHHHYLRFKEQRGWKWGTEHSAAVRSPSQPSPSIHPHTTTTPLNPHSSTTRPRTDDDPSIINVHRQTFLKEKLMSCHFLLMAASLPRKLYTIPTFNSCIWKSVFIL